MTKIPELILLAAFCFSVASCNQCKQCTLTSVFVKDEAGNKYYPWSDGTFRDIHEGASNDSLAKKIGITCLDLQDCVDSTYRKFCGADLDNVEQQPYIVSGLTSGDSLFTAEYTYSCK